MASVCALAGRDQGRPYCLLPLLPTAYCLLLTAFCLRRRFRHVLVKIAGRVGVLKLDGGMGDAELARERLTDSLRNPLAFGGGHVENLDVAGKRVRLRSQAPDVDVVDFAHAGD